MSVPVPANNVQDDQFFNEQLDQFATVVIDDIVDPQHSFFHWNEEDDSLSTPALVHHAQIINHHTSSSHADESDFFDQYSPIPHADVMPIDSGDIVHAFQPSDSSVIPVEGYNSLSGNYPSPVLCPAPGSQAIHQIQMIHQAESSMLSQNRLHSTSFHRQNDSPHWNQTSTQAMSGAPPCLTTMHTVTNLIPGINSHTLLTPVPVLPIQSDPRSTQSDFRIDHTKAQTVIMPSVVLNSAPSKRPKCFKDLPDEIVRRILSFCCYRAERDIPEQGHDPPHELLPMSSVSTRYRDLVASMCRKLSFDPLSRWFYVHAWLRLASRYLDEVQVYELIEDDEDVVSARIFPPAYIFDAIHRYARNLRKLDFSGVHMRSEMDSDSLGRLLASMRQTLVDLVVTDIRSDTRRILTNAIRAGRLERLTAFNILMLEPHRGIELQEMLESFRNPYGDTALRKLVLLVNIAPSLGEAEDSVTVFGEGNVFESFRFPVLTQLEISYFTGYIPQLPRVPNEFIRCFVDLQILKLELIRIASISSFAATCALGSIVDLRVYNCQIEEDGESILSIPGSGLPARGLMDFIKGCGEKLTALWSPSQSLNRCELEELCNNRPSLTELGFVLARNGGAAFRRLCHQAKHSLTKVGIYGKRGERMQKVTSEDQFDIVEGLQMLSLESISSSRIDISTRNMCRIVAGGGYRLRVIDIETNFDDCAKNQLRCLLQLLHTARSHCPNLATLYVGTGTKSPMRLPKASFRSLFGMLIVDIVQQLETSAPKLKRIDLDTLKNIWISHHERNDGITSDDEAEDYRHVGEGYEEDPEDDIDVLGVEEFDVDEQGDEMEAAEEHEADGGSEGGGDIHFSDPRVDASFSSAPNNAAEGCFVPENVDMDSFRD